MNALHVALKETGMSERFIPVFPGGQDVYHLFGVPEVLARFTSRYGIPLGGTVDDAVRIGREYERKVIDLLKKAGD